MKTIINTIIETIKFWEEKGMDYKNAGVDIEAGYKSVELMKEHVKKTMRPEVLVLDDSFSALDYATDARLRQALAREQADTAVLVVAQRIATVMGADQIIVLDDGHVVGRGTHEELLRSCPEYLEIAKSQLSTKELGLEEGE